MQPLIDADVLLYEVGFGCEVGWDEPGYPPFDRAKDLLESKIAHICAQVDATHPPILFLTGQGNFRYDIAKRTPYKARPGNKPFHYKNLKAYIKGMYDYRESENCEADDLMCAEQFKRPEETIVCSRDKDCFTYSGWKYGWECHNQPSIGPVLVDTMGSLCMSENGKKLSGFGESFFYSQCLMGDSVDSVPGLPQCGKKKAFQCLFGVKSREDAYNRVLGMYRKSYGDKAEEELLEQARLLHMSREIDDNRILLWNPPNVDYKDWFNVDTRTIERTPLLQ